MTEIVPMQMEDWKRMLPGLGFVVLLASIPAIIGFVVRRSVTIATVSVARPRLGMALAGHFIAQHPPRSTNGAQELLHRELEESRRSQAQLGRPDQARASGRRAARRPCSLPQARSVARLPHRRHLQPRRSQRAAHHSHNTRSNLRGTGQSHLSFSTRVEPRPTVSVIERLAD